jgi:aminoglycoside phosphotransferase (APT) family kinase protein
VELALHPRIMQQYLTSSDTAQQVTSSVAAPCHILDAKYDPGAGCSILYQLGERMVIGELQWNETARSKGPGIRGQGTVAQMEIYPFERDPALPGLTTVLDGQRMAAILNATLPECTAGKASVVRCHANPLRYRLGKRCTLRFDLWLRDGQSGALTKRTLYGKLYHSAHKAQAVYEEMQMLAAALPMQKVALAQAVAFAPELPMVFQAPVAGMPLDILLSQPKRTAIAYDQRVQAGIRGAAAALAALHQVEMGSNRLRPVAAELERFKRRSAQIMDVAPRIGADLDKLAQALPAWLDQLPAWGAETCLVHGDCKPSQFFMTPGSQDERGANAIEYRVSSSGDSPTLNTQYSTLDTAVALLDFDHCGMADPAADVGNFLATLRQLGIRQALKQRQPHTQRLAALEELFLTEYLAARPCHANFRLRATWYQAVALLRKALRSFARSPRSPLPALLVEEAWRCLQREEMVNGERLMVNG